ncbi:hypothetical protein ITJ55_03755 [Frigoribacterium sp. VKM Ac-1396]|uniref:hypothetical protein n=1 Tax=Frigoribacterium sp. VKM Ac-1396 TaxID=2783821 RepID=UPI00188AF4A5|nr:hypothetical protein [Frigoribacterium sp. VKM Ac-1396]MBF4599919.1 hypothetical protein [Frigoribacterium sp. VKM Ac-1396]
MITKFSWRRAVAVPAVLTLALGGALLSTTAAQAVDSDLMVTSPLADTPTDSRLVTVAGTAIADANVIIKDTNTDGTVLARTTTDGSGAFSTTIQYSDDADETQTIFVDGEKGFSGFDPTVTRSFTLPAVAPVETFEVVTPKAGQELDSRTVTFSGTGLSGSTVNVLDTNDDRLPGTGAVAVVDGQWSLEYTYPDDADRNQTVRVTEVTGGSGTGDTEVSFVLPAAVVPPTTPDALDTPVITSPEQGETVTGTEVTFEGTGTPGADIGLVVAPTDSVSTLADDPADRIVVDADGNWTVTLALAPAEYTAVAVQALLDENGDPVLDGTGAPIVSAPSTPVDFTLEAAAVAPFEAPVVTSPSAGQAVVGSTLNVTGTGTPGARVAFVIYAQGGQPQSSQPFEQAQAESTIVVDAAGNWSSTVTGLVPGAYTIAPFSFALNAAGETTAVATGDPVDFTVVAAVVTAATPTTPSGLAYTGSEGTETAAGIGAAALLAGALLLIAARRRAKLAVAETPAE